MADGDATARVEPPICVAVLNDAPDTLGTLAKWLEIHGMRVVTARMAEMRQAHRDIEAFVARHRPDVIVFDVAIPYRPNWDFAELLREMPATRDVPTVITTPNRQALESLVGETPVLEIVGGPEDLTALLEAVRSAAGRR